MTRAQAEALAERICGIDWMYDANVLHDRERGGYCVMPMIPAGPIIHDVPDWEELKAVLIERMKAAEEDLYGSDDDDDD